MKKLGITLSLVGAAARLAPEDLHLGREVTTAPHVPWEPAHTLLLLEPIMNLEKAPEPARSQRAVGRNEPCPCGSGRKSKKCSAAAG